MPWYYGVRSVLLVMAIVGAARSTAQAQEVVSVDAVIDLARTHYAAGRYSEAQRVLDAARRDPATRSAHGRTLDRWRRRLLEEVRAPNPAVELHLERNAPVERRRSPAAIRADARAAVAASDPDMTAGYWLGGLGLGVGAVLLLSSIVVALVPGCFLSSFCSGSGPDTDAAAILAGTGGALVSLGLGTLIVSYVVDGDGWSARAHVGPDHMRIEFRLAL